MANEIINDVELMETSAVGIPAYPDAINKELLIEKAKVTAMEEKRKQLGMSESEFYAFPRLKKLPIFDEAHVRNAMARFNQTTGWTEEEKKTAYNKIISRAKKYGINIDNFKQLKPKEVDVKMTKDEIKKDELEEKKEETQEEQPKEEVVEEPKEEPKEEAVEEAVEEKKTETEIEKDIKVSLSKEEFNKLLDAVKDEIKKSLTRESKEKKETLFEKNIEKSVGELGAEWIKGGN